MKADEYRTVVEHGLDWLQKMLPVADGSEGVYERFRISAGQVNPWVRPDCSMEVARAFFAYGSQRAEPDWCTRGLRLAHFVRSLQRSGEGFARGSFPFYQFRPADPLEPDIGDAFGIPNLPARAWPSDNGKVVWLLLWLHERSADELLLQAALSGLEYLLRTQSEDGSFSRTASGDEAAFRGTDFVAWPTIALIAGALVTADERHREGALGGLAWLRDHRHPSGRALTSYETAKTEAWRPPSSETAASLTAFARGMRLFPEHAWVRACMDGLGQAFVALQHPSGGVRNCLGASCSASLQNDPNVTDLVYTNGYGLLALLDAYAASDDTEYLAAARRLAAFLSAIQCRGESAAYDGSWRGSYHLDQRIWYGRADQENPLDEGGMDAAYTGWTCAPVLYGLLRLMHGNGTEL